MLLVLPFVAKPSLSGRPIEGFTLLPISRLNRDRVFVTGFTFIEVLITLSIIAICFLPLMQMFSTSLEQVHITEDLTGGRYLAQEEMEQVKNSGFTEAQLSDLGDTWKPPLDQPPIDLNGRKWRVLRKIIKGTAPLEVHVQVYRVPEKLRTEEFKKPIVELVTLIEDLDWSPAE